MPFRFFRIFSIIIITIIIPFFFFNLIKNIKILIKNLKTKSTWIPSRSGLVRLVGKL